MTPIERSNICKVYYGDNYWEGNINNLGTTLSNYYSTMIGEGESFTIKIIKPKLEEMLFGEIEKGDVHFYWDNAYMKKTSKEETISGSEDSAIIETSEKITIDDDSNEEITFDTDVYLTDDNYVYISYGTTQKDIVQYRIQYSVGEQYLKFIDINSDQIIKVLIYSEPPTSILYDTLKENIETRTKLIFYELSKGRAIT